MDYKIKAMAASHIDALAKLEEVCFSTPWTKEGLSEELANEQSHFLVAVRDETVLGYVGVQEICGEAYITNIAVLPEYRKSGIASALLKSASDGAVLRECEFLSLEVRVSNAPAISLYEKSGFSLVGRRKNFYREPTEDALIYTLYFKESNI